MAPEGRTNEDSGSGRDAEPDPAYAGFPTLAKGQYPYQTRRLDLTVDMGTDCIGYAQFFEVVFLKTSKRPMLIIQKYP